MNDIWLTAGVNKVLPGNTAGQYILEIMNSRFTAMTKYVGDHKNQPQNWPNNYFPLQ